VRGPAAAAEPIKLESAAKAPTKVKRRA
jgi:hypothetical protein